MFKRAYRPMNTMFCKIMEKMKSAGKKRRLSVLLAAAMVLCLAATLLAACNKGDKLPSDTPVSWEDILSEAAEEVTERVALSGDKIGVKFTADITLGGNAYSLFFGLNYDLSAKDGSSLVLKVSEAENSAGEGTDAETAASDGTLFSVAADGEYTWIDIAAGLAVPDAKLRVENVDLFDLLGVIYDEENSDAAVEAFSEVVYNLGMTFFDGARVSADGSEYRFDVNSDYKETGREYFAAVFSVFGENVSGALLAAFGISDAYELLDVLPELGGYVTLRFTDDNVEFSAEGLTVSGEEAWLDAELRVSREYFTETEGMIPQKDEGGYLGTKLGNTHMSGDITLRAGESDLVTCDYTLDANLDILRLVLHGYDLTCLGEENYFHLRVTHVCGSECGGFCESRLEPSRGAVLDIAFSPEDFGSYNIYISAALSSLVSSSFASLLAEDYGRMAEELIPEYILYVYPDGLFDEESSMCKLLSGLFADNMFATGDTEASFEEATGIVSLFAEFMSDDVSPTPDGLVFGVEENAFGMAERHNIYDETVYIIDGKVSELKDYGSYEGDIGNLERSDSIALSWEWEEPQEVEEDGERVSLTGIYSASGTLLHGVSDGEYVPMSPEEITGMMGGFYLKADCLNLDKTTHFDFYGRVLAVEGLDIDSREPQTVTFTVEYPNPFSAYETPRDDILPELTEKVSARIMLTDRTTPEVVFIPRVSADTELEIISKDTPDGDGLYSGQSTELPDFIFAEGRVEYVNGYTKSMELVGETDAVGVRDMVIFSDYYYSTEAGDVTVKWTFMDGSEELTYHIADPDRVEFDIAEDRMPSHGVGDTVYMSTITNHVKAVAYYDYADGTSKGIKLYLTADNFYIRNIPLSESSRDWTSTRMLLGGYTVTFLVANDFECTARVFTDMSDPDDPKPFESEPFTQRVTAYEGDRATYKFVQTSSENVFWFTDTEYLFAGDLVNATHGVSLQPERTLTLSVLKYTSDSPQYGTGVDLSAEGGAVTLGAFTAEGFSATETAGVLRAEALPALIVSPLRISFRLTFNEAGHYRVRLLLSGNSGYLFDKYITVAE